MFTFHTHKKQGLASAPNPVQNSDKRLWFATKNVVSFRYFTWLLTLALFLGLVGCSPTAVPAAVQPEPTQPAVEETAAFPVTITHKYGATTLAKAPERVVVIGYNEQDIYFALGVKPVAVRYWYGDAPHAIFPWAVDEAAGAEPELLEMPFGELNLEAIVNLKPDLISGLYSGITAEEYEQLSLIAPTIAQSADYIEFGIPWQYATQTIGDALGKGEEAAGLVANVEGQFTKAQEANPAFVGKTMAVAYANGDGTYGFYTAQDARARFFTNLGFEIPAELTEIAGESFYANLSQEKLTLLDQDVLLFLGLQFLEGGRETITNDPLLNQLAAVKEGRVVFVPLEVDDALQFGSVLSLEYALAGILPELQAAVGEAEARNHLFPVTLNHKLGSITIPAAP